jgi:hypothetical protein
MSDLLTYENTDIDWELARRAHAGTSMVPEQRTNQESNGYLSQMAWLVETFAPFETPENSDDLRADLEAYRIEYVKRLEHHWGVKARCVSTMIAGPSGFNVRRAEKANEAERNSLQRMLDWRQKALDRTLARYDPSRQDTAIRSDDGDAIDKLRAKIDEAQAHQDAMKAANKAATGERPYPHFKLTNNSANIRRMKARLVQLEAEAARPEAQDRESVILGEPVTVTGSARSLPITKREGEL